MKKYQYVFDETKENNISNNHDFQPNPHHSKSSASTHLHTHHKASTQNLYIHKLQSLILDLQREADQQQFQIHSLSQQSTLFTKICEQQKQILASMNIQSLHNQYKQQISQMNLQRHKIQEIIAQLQADYEEAFKREEKELGECKRENQQICQQIDLELEEKKRLLGEIAVKNGVIERLEEEMGEAEEKVDQLRNIQRKFRIAVKEVQELGLL